MQANLQWIQQEWRKWLETERGKKAAPGRVNLGTEHVAKLFATFCLDQLRAETGAMGGMSSGVPLQKADPIKPHSSVIYTDLTVRCSKCRGTLIWRYLEDKDEIEIFHGCTEGGGALVEARNLSPEEAKK